MKAITLSLLSAAALVGTPALAADRSVTLAVDNMSCVTCVPTVRMSLSQVPGVRRVEVSAEARTATVVYDDRVTNVAALISATTNAGYPSHPKR